MQIKDHPLIFTFNQGEHKKLRILKTEVVGYEFWGMKSDGNQVQFNILFSGNRSIHSCVLNSKDAENLQKQLDEILEDSDNF